MGNLSLIHILYPFKYVVINVLPKLDLLTLAVIRDETNYLRYRCIVLVPEGYIKNLLNDEEEVLYVLDTTQGSLCLHKLKTLYTTRLGLFLTGDFPVLHQATIILIYIVNLKNYLLPLRTSEYVTNNCNHNVRFSIHV